MLGLGSNITGGSPVGIVGAAPPSNYFYESDFLNDVIAFSSSDIEVVDHEGRTDCLKVTNKTTRTSAIGNLDVTLNPGYTYNIDLWYYAPSSSSVDQIRIYASPGFTYLEGSIPTKNQWVNKNIDFAVNNQTAFYLYIYFDSVIEPGDYMFISDIKIIQTAN